MTTARRRLVHRHDIERYDEAIPPEAASARAKIEEALADPERDGFDGGRHRSPSSGLGSLRAGYFRFLTGDHDDPFEDYEVHRIEPRPAPVRTAELPSGPGAVFAGSQHQAKRTAQVTDKIGELREIEF